MSGSSNADIAAARFLAVFSLEQKPLQSDEEGDEEDSIVHPSHGSIATSSAADSLTSAGDKRALSSTSSIQPGAKRRRTMSKEIPSDIITYNVVPDLLTILWSDPSCSEAPHGRNMSACMT